MKYTIIVLAMLMCIGILTGQDITGDWNGMLEAGGMKLRLVLHITAVGDSLSATFDSPDQGAFGLEVSSVTYDPPRLVVEVASPRIIYSGELKDGVIVGTFNQSGFTAPLDMHREELEAPVYNRPQDPKEPYPYRVEDVKFENWRDGITLAGTLTLPTGAKKYPAVVLISGSGAQDRNEELLGHKPFLVIADHLTRNGIAVLRYDDRGHAESEGDYATATSADFATDVMSAVRYLQSRNDIGTIGLMGHSEGGIIAPMVASEMPDVGFIVLLAGTGIRGDKLLLKQEELILKAGEQDQEYIENLLYVNSRVFDMVINIADTDSLKAHAREFIQRCVADSLVEVPEGFTPQEMIEQSVNQTTSPWMLYFIRHDPAPVLEKVRCPVLALNGSKDLQVPPKENLDAIAAALEQGGNTHFRTVEFKYLNHLFQECETGHPSEYATIEQTFSPRVLNVITRWIKEQTGLK